MKKTLHILSILVLLAVLSASCSKLDAPKEKQADVTSNFEDNGFSPSSTALGANDNHGDGDDDSITDPDHDEDHDRDDVNSTTN